MDVTAFIIAHVQSDERPVLPDDIRLAGYMLGVPAGQVRRSREVHITAGIDELAVRIEELKREAGLLVRVMSRKLHDKRVTEFEYTHIFVHVHCINDVLSVPAGLPVTQTHSGRLALWIRTQFIVGALVPVVRIMMNGMAAPAVIEAVVNSIIAPTPRATEIALLRFDVRVAEVQIIKAVLADILDQLVVQRLPRTRVLAADSAHAEMIGTLHHARRIERILRGSDIIAAIRYVRGRVTHVILHLILGGVAGP